MSTRALLPTIFPILAAFFTVAYSAPSPSQTTEKAAATLLGPSDLRSFVDFAPAYFRFYDSNEVAWPSDYDWTVGNMLARHESSSDKRKRASAVTADPPAEPMLKRLFVARIGKRGRMMPIYRARVG